MAMCTAQADTSTTNVVLPPLSTISAVGCNRCGQRLVLPMETLTTPALVALLALIAFAALLYSSVGHGGASGYLAAMALFGLAPVFMKPAALAMNIVVAGLVFYRLWRAGYFDARLFWPFALGSIPLAVVGGALTLPGGAKSGR